MTHPRDEIHRALAGLEAWLDSDLAFGLDSVAGAPRANGTHQATEGRGAAREAMPIPDERTPPAPPPPPPPRVARKSIPPLDVPVPVPPLREVLGATEKHAKLRELADRIYGCNGCRLCEHRTFAVPGEGNADADLMFIGEGPGADEDRSGRPFVGASGELLTKIIVAMGFSRETVFIANIVKCQPPGNRAPNPDEIAACYSYLRAQIDIVRPRVLCTLGSPASRTLLGVTTGITQLRGKIMQFAGIPVIPTFHPAYLLRSPEDKPLVWQDAQKIAELVLTKGGTIPFPDVFERSRRGKK